MPKFLLHTILLVASTALVYWWLATASFTSSTLQLVACLTLLYIGTHWLKKHKPSWFHKSTVTLDLTILTSMILLLVAETGALSSPFFFLLYFLLFSVAMLYEVEATLVLTGVLILFFMFIPGTRLSDLEHLTQLIALVMITPLAIFTGYQYETVVEERKLREKLTKHLTQEETDTLLFLSLNLKTTLLQALDSLSLTIPQAGKSIRYRLENLYSDLKALYRTAHDLERSIDKETDNTYKS